MRKRNLIIFISLIIVVLAGVALFFYVGITGEVASEFIPPVDKDPFLSPLPKTFPYEKDIDEQKAALIEKCETTKLIEEFVCSAYEKNYPKDCKFWSGRCKGMEDLCELAKDEVEKRCSPSVIGS